MRDRHRMRRAPPWWPANEQWPPAHGAHAWRSGRARFVRRAGLVFACLLLLSALGTARLLSWIASVVAGGPVRLPPVFTGLAIAFALFAVLSVAMRRFGFPLGDIVGAANRVANGDYSARVSEHGPPSLRTVARAFNSMTSRLQLQEEQRRHLMADIAHELRTPLTVIQGRLEGLIDGVYPRDEARLTQLLDDTRMLARLVDDLRTLANAESGTLTLQKEPTDLGILLQDVVKTFSEESAARHVAVNARAGSDLPLVDVDPVRMREVLTNLVSNALHHTPAGGSVSLIAAVRGDRLAIDVADSGAGIVESDLPRIFDRFYKGIGSSGSGLGLTISKNLVEAHGGDIRAASLPGEGTTITFTIPLFISVAQGFSPARSAALKGCATTDL
jgi:signal transduction histidine kinase